jgi:hypothetical protein
VIRSFDVETAFLNAKLKETIYMEEPEGFKSAGNKVVLLQKSIYGLKQSPRLWQQELQGTLLELGFRLTCDNSIYVHDKDETILGVYVDDLLCLSKTNAIADELLQQLQKKYKLKDEGKVKKYLGLEIQQSNDGTILLHQQIYITGVEKKLGIERNLNVKTPGVLMSESNWKAPSPETKLNETEYKRFRELIGTLSLVIVPDQMCVSKSVI